MNLFQKIGKVAKKGAEATVGVAVLAAGVPAKPAIKAIEEFGEETADFMEDTQTEED